MEEINERIKKKYNLSRKEFFKGDWLQNVEKDLGNFDKIHINYINGHLMIRGYSIKSKESKNE